MIPKSPFLLKRLEQIGVDRFGLANQGFMAGIGLSEGPEAKISIDVINDEGAMWS